MKWKISGASSTAEHAPEGQLDRCLLCGEKLGYADVLAITEDEQHACCESCAEDAIEFWWKEGMPK